MALALTACGGDSKTNDAAGEASGKITVWTLESLPDRMKVTEDIVKDFTAKTGIEVELVGLEEEQAPQLIQSSGLSDDLPDLAAAFPVGLVHDMHTNDLVDTEAAARIVDALGKDTFQSKALELMQADGKTLGVPSDGWSQILVYRTDLFEAAGLEAPTTYEALEKAAKTLTKDGKFGISLATDPADVFTQQTFEALALGNNCQLISDAGEVDIESEQCKKTFELYKALGESSPAGAQTVDSTRAAYFNGSAAMTMWSTYLLDELAGLRDDALPSCPECKNDPEYLAKNTGVVVEVKGSDGKADSGSYGEVTGFVPLKDGNTAATEKFVEYMMNEGYEKWLGMAPEGKFPMRTGDAGDKERFSKAWAQMETGVDRKAPLGQYYSDDVINTLTSLGEDVDRWGLPQGRGDVIGAFTAELPLSKAVAEMISGGMAPDAAAAEVGAATREMVK